MKKRLHLLLTAILVSFAGNAQTTQDTQTKERLEQHVYTLASDTLRGRKAGSQYARMAADYIAKQWEEIGIEPYYGNSYMQSFKKGKFQNVVGIIRGSDPVLKNEYIVVGAHYDHLGVRFWKIYSGADDNASGVAAMIEAGRELKRNEANLKRSVILIAFDAEERGLVGSSHFIYNWEEPKENIKLVISPDMVGWYRASGMVEYAGSGTMKNGHEMIVNQQQVHSGLNVVIKEFEKNILTGTDTQPFGLKKIPTLYVNTGFKSPYHKPRDKAHLIDYDGLTLITGHLKNIVETASRDTDLEPTGKISKKHKPRQRIGYGVSANFGSSIHFYTAGESGEKTAFSFGAGLMSQVNFGCFAIRPELQYDFIQAHHPAGKIATNNITVPLSLVFQTPEKSFWGFDLFAGGYYSYRFSGKQGSENLDFANSYHRNECGITFGVGFNLKPFKFGSTRRIALTDFSQKPNADNAHLRNWTNYFTIMYMF